MVLQSPGDLGFRGLGPFRAVYEGFGIGVGVCRVLNFKWASKRFEA